MDFSKSVICFDDMCMDDIYNGLTTYGLDGKVLITILNFFLSEDNKKGVVIQCPSYHHIPYVRRTVMSLLGVPDKFLNDRLVYGKKSIKLVSVSKERELMGEDEDKLFYLSSLDQNYEQKDVLGRFEICESRSPWNIITLWDVMGISASDMFSALQFDGYTSKESALLLDQYYKPLHQYP